MTESGIGGPNDGGDSSPARRAGEEMVTMMFWYGWAWWQVSLMWVGMIAFWGLLIWAVYALIANVTRRPGPEHRGDDARSILDGRLARGEISPEEYQRLRDLLESGTRRAASGTGS